MVRRRIEVYVNVNDIGSIRHLLLTVVPLFMFVIRCVVVVEIYESIMPPDIMNAVDLISSYINFELTHSFYSLERRMDGFDDK